MATKIHQTAIIEDGAIVGDGVTIGAYSHIGANVVLGEGCVLETHVCIQGHTSVGKSCHIFPFVVLGGPPQHLAYGGEDTKLIIGENNQIREHVTMHTGTVDGRGETRVGNNGLFMAGAHVAHDCVVGDDTVFANDVLIGGHVVVEDYVFLGGGAAVHQYCQIGAHAFIGGGAAVIHDVIPFGSANGNYAKLESLNIIGLKRRGFSRQDIDSIRATHKVLFSDGGPFQDRLESAKQSYSSKKYPDQIFEFIHRDRTRPLMMAG